MYKSFDNNDILREHIKQQVVLSGWVFRRRDHGGVIFIDLRDRSGYCQVVFREEVSKNAHTKAENIRSEYVIRVKGTIVPRTPENVNPDLKTGEVEVEVNDLEILSTSKTPVFSLDEADQIKANEEVRLKYRFLDLRREEIKTNLVKRHAFVQAVRHYLNKNKFLEIETPILNKATPEGARDFIVPSRSNPCTFYALPQSPQIFKQILMISGFERYYQIVKCFRDEDLRADRQPEFTQIDLEMSFLTKEQIMEQMEELITSTVKEVFPEQGKHISLPLPKMTYWEAMECYGTDRPDTRFEMHLINVEEAVKGCDFQVFKNVLAKGGIIRSLCIKNGKALSRKDIENYTQYIGQFGAKGLAWMRVTESGLESNIVKFFPEANQEALLKITDAQTDDLLLFVADVKSVTYSALGNLRIEIAKHLKLIDESKFNFLWVHAFPLFEYDTVEKRYYSVHHPFTMPNEEDLPKIETDPGKVTSQAYDLILNGVELGGGSVRIHNSNMQEKIFSILGIGKEEAKMKFGFLLEALQYGAPPHGGIAFGLDRIIMLMQKRNSIRDVIAFPKTQKGICLMSESPSIIEEEQLEEVSIRIIKP